MVGKSGDYFVHPDRAREFGSDLGRPTDWRTDFPALAPLLGSTRSITQAIPDQSGKPDGVALASAILAGNEWVGIIETVSNAVIIGPAVQVRNTALTVGLIAVLCATALALLIARSLTRPIVQLTAAVEAIARGDRAVVPVEATGETGVLARAFARMIADAAPPHLRATSFGAFYFVSGIATLLASLGAGLLWDKHGAHATFLAGAGVAAVAMAMLSLLPEERPAPSA